MGLAIKTSHLRCIIEEPDYISERLMTLHVPLVRGEHMLRKTCPKDKIILLGDFNARVSSRTDLWREVLGTQGIGNMNTQRS